jgi:hypothetical protein
VGNFVDNPPLTLARATGDAGFNKMLKAYAKKSPFKINHLCAAKKPLSAYGDIFLQAAIFVHKMDRSLQKIGGKSA